MKKHQIGSSKARRKKSGQRSLADQKSKLGFGFTYLSKAVGFVNQVWTLIEKVRSLLSYDVFAAVLLR